MLQHCYCTTTICRFIKGRVSSNQFKNYVVNKQTKCFVLEESSKGIIEKILSQKPHNSSVFITKNRTELKTGAAYYRCMLSFIPPHSPRSTSASKSTWSQHHPMLRCAVLKRMMPVEAALLCGTTLQSSYNTHRGSQSNTSICLQKPFLHCETIFRSVMPELR